jgi:AraC-like DNA-binding protein
VDYNRGTFRNRKRAVRRPTLPAANDDDALASLRATLVERVAQLAPGYGLHEVPQVPGLRLFRSDTLDGTISSIYEPCVAVILQGRKQIVLGQKTLIHDSRRYLVSSLDLPTAMTIQEASPARPYLAFALRLDLREIASLVLDGSLPRPPATAEERAISTAVVTLPLLDAFRRLLDLAERPADAPVLAPLVRREIMYRLLTGEAGARLRRIATADGQGHQIARAIERLKTRYTETLRVEQLARNARMSGSTFHHHFKALTSMSPLQYQKSLRLIEARRLMLTEKVDVSTAAYRVGYESPSQFSREYSRQFGAPPTRDIAALREEPG